MLHSFTWQQFLIAFAALSACWYAVVLLLYFRPEIRALFFGWRGGSPKPSAQEAPSPSTPDGEAGLMGKPAEPEGVESVSADEFSFAQVSSVPSSQPDAAAKVKRLGVVSDVMHELKTMVTLLRQENGSKEEFYGLFNHIKRTYPSIRESSQLGALTSYLEEHLPFTLTEEEKKDLWN